MTPRDPVPSPCPSVLSPSVSQSPTKPSPGCTLLFVLPSSLGLWKSVTRGFQHGVGSWSVQGRTNRRPYPTGVRRYRDYRRPCLGIHLRGPELPLRPSALYPSVSQSTVNPSTAPPVGAPPWPGATPTSIRSFPVGLSPDNSSPDSSPPFVLPSSFGFRRSRVRRVHQGVGSGSVWVGTNRKSDPIGVRGNRGHGRFPLVVTLQDPVQPPGLPTLFFLGLSVPRQPFTRLFAPLSSFPCPSVFGGRKYER